MAPVPPFASKVMVQGLVGSSGSGSFSFQRAGIVTASLSWKITYNLNGGYMTGSGPTSYNLSDQAQTLNVPVPYKSGFTLHAVIEPVAQAHVLVVHHRAGDGSGGGALELERGADVHPVSSGPT